MCSCSFFHAIFPNNKKAFLILGYRPKSREPKYIWAQGKWCWILSISIQFVYVAACSCKKNNKEYHTF
jgi:hypothetical protein